MIDKLATTWLLARLANVPTSDPIEDVVLGVQKWYDHWWKTKSALEAYKEDMTQKLYNPMPYSRWRQLFRPDLKVVKTRSMVEFDIDRNLPCAEEAEEFIQSYLPKRGWFLKTESRGSHSATLTFESRRGERIVDVPQHLWHATRYEYLKSIMKRGLVPKHHADEDDFPSMVLVRKYPDRIYLALTEAAVEKISGLLAINDIETHHSMEEIYGGGLSLDDYSKYVTFKVDTSKLKKGTKFYKDPDFPEGVYTYTHIPPTALSLTADSKRDVDKWDLDMLEPDPSQAMVASLVSSYTRV